MLIDIDTLAYRVIGLLLIMQILISKAQKQNLRFLSAIEFVKSISMNSIRIFSN